MDSATPFDFVSIDVIGNNGSDYGYLAAFDSSDNLIARAEPAPGALRGLRRSRCSPRRVA